MDYSLHPELCQSRVFGIIVACDRRNELYSRDYGFYVLNVVVVVNFVINK